MAYEAKSLLWDVDGERKFEAGVSHGVLYSPIYDENGVIKKVEAGYGKGTDDLYQGVAWNGLTGVTEKPTGAEATKLWANNGLYATIRSAEGLQATIEAYTYPDEWKQHNGQHNPKKEESTKAAYLATVGQQARKSFRLSYITQVGDDQNVTMPDEKLHLVYNATASPAERAYKTINDSPEAITFSWEMECSDTKCSIVDMAPNGKLCDISIDLFNLKKDHMDIYKALMKVLHGSDTEGSVTGTIAYLPSPETIYAILKGEPAPTNTSEASTQNDVSKKPFSKKN